MGLLTQAGHIHHCPTCAKDWTHRTRACSADAELPCPEHPATPEPAPPVRPAEVWAPARPIDADWVKKS